MTLFFRIRQRLGLCSESDTPTDSFNDHHWNCFSSRKFFRKHAPTIFVTGNDVILRNDDIGENDVIERSGAIEMSFRKN